MVLLQMAFHPSSSCLHYINFLLFSGFLFFTPEKRWIYVVIINLTKRIR